MAYSAPECFGEKIKLEPAMDLYSVGAVLYHAMTGQSPFQGTDRTLLLNEIQNRIVPPVATLVFDCPVWLSAIVEQLLNKDPMKRPYSAAATAMALREAHKRASEGIGVAQHAVSGFSPLQMNASRDEAEKVLGHKKKKSKRRDRDDEELVDAPGLLERPFVLLGILAVAIALIAFLVWPANERTLRARAEALIAKKDLGSLNDARDKYLYDIVERFPDGANALWAQEQLDLIEMENAEAKLQSNLRFGREPSSEGERKFAEASRFERFGDRVTALEQYKGIVSLLKDEKKDRPFVNLARRQIEKIESNPPSVEELRKFLREKLEQADDLYAKGDAIGSKQIWEGIVSLYNGNKEMLPVVEQAMLSLSKIKK
jgi:serine/threonine protein kinase